MSTDSRRSPRGRLHRGHWRLRSRRAAVSLGLVPAVGGAASLASYDPVPGDQVTLGRVQSSAGGALTNLTVTVK